MVKVAQALREAAERLAPVSDTARLDAELLLANALGCTRGTLLLNRMADPVPANFAALIKRRLASEPVAYITGVQEFYGRPFAVSPAVLIPRADSESVITAALARMDRAGRVLDCGTGSGALLLTLLAERPGWSGIGIDASAEALAVAAANAANLALDDRAALRRADWTQPGWKDGLAPFDLIIANPPYVEAHAALSREVRDYEPHAALFAGEDGLADYRVLISQLGSLLAPAGWVVLEIGATQGAAVKTLAWEAGFAGQILPDLAGRDRAVALQRAGTSRG